MLFNIEGLNRELFPKASESDGSDSESDQEGTDARVFYNQVIDDYISTDNANVGRFQKIFTEEMERLDIDEWTLQLMEHAKLYRTLETKCYQLFAGGKNVQQNRARYLFCCAAQIILRMGNSSAILERIFGDTLRSAGQKRTSIRKDSILKVDTLSRYLVYI